MIGAMTGQVRNGVVVLDEGSPPLAEGMRVRVTPISASAAQSPTLAERLKKITGQARGLPIDMAEQHDHYIHGQPKNR